MPDFLDENLSPEELKGGFEPTDKDDETFLLESIGNYPGILPYEIELSVEAQIPKEISVETAEIKNLQEEESFGETSASTRANLLDSDDELKPYEKSGLVAEDAEQVSYEKSGLVAEDAEQVSYEKSGLVAEDAEQVSYEKSGLVAEDAEQVSYEKSGLVAEDAEQVSYEKSGLVAEDAEQVSYEKSGLIAEDAEQVSYEKSGLIAEDSVDYEKAGSIQDETKSAGESILPSVWDLFEEETASAIEDKEITQETTIQDEQVTQEPLEPESIVTEEVLTEDIAESIARETSLEGIEKPPVEIKIADYNEEEFKEVLDENFRKEIEEELEQSKERKGRVEKGYEDIASELTTTEKEELQKGFGDGGGRTGVADFIEIDLTAMKVRKPSEFLAYEMREKVDFADFLKSALKAKETKKVKKQKKAKKPKKVKGEPPMPMKSPEEIEIPKEGKPIQVEEPQKWGEREESPEQISSLPQEGAEVTETKKKRLIPIWVWFPAAGVILLFIAVGGYFLLSERFWGKKKPEIVKTKVEKKQEQKSIVTPPVEQKRTPSEPKQVVDKSAKAESEPQQPAKPDVRKEPKSKVSLVQRTKTEPKTKTDLKSEKSSIAKIEKPIEPPVAKIIENVPLTEYSIEVFSSSEPDEANYWKNILNKKGIDALIKVHKVRNVDVYCVRVGTFKNIDEARAYAKSKGFKNIWIDRIK